MSATNEIEQVQPVEELPPEMIRLILQNLNKKERINACLVSHLFNNLIRHDIGIHYLTLKKPSDCRHLKDSPLLKNTRISSDWITLPVNELVNLAGVHRLDLQTSGASDKGILALLQGGKHRIHEIDLRGSFITDVSLKALRHVHTINIIECPAITIEGIKALKDAYCVTVHEAKDTWLRELCNVHTLVITNGYSCTDDGIKTLTNVKELRMCFNDTTGIGLKDLVNLEALVLGYCENLTNDCLKNLVNLKYLELQWCPKVTSSVLKQLKSLKYVRGDSKCKITRKDVESLGLIWIERQTGWPCIE